MYCTVDPLQLVYVHVYVFVPEQTGSALTTGPVTVNGFPQLLFTTGGVGTTCASLTQGTVAEPGAGAVAVGGLIVYVYTHGLLSPSQSVYVQVYVLIPEHTGSALTTGPVIVSGAPQLLLTTGGVGIVCALLTHGTVEPPAAGIVNVGGLTV